MPGQLNVSELLPATFAIASAAADHELRSIRFRQGG